VFIGDSETDIICANNIKCKSIYIGSEKINHRPTYDVKDSKELLNILKENNFIVD
jgi:phosphoglycolate phosphatase-like HAD superfamily hydrolase